MVGSALSNGSGHLPVVSVKVQRHCPGDVRRSGSRRKRLRLRWHRRKRRGPGGGGGRMLLWGIFGGGFFFVFVFFLVGLGRVSLLYVFFWRAQVYKKTPGKILIITKVFTREWFKKTFWSCFFTTGPELRPLSFTCDSYGSEDFHDGGFCVFWSFEMKIQLPMPWTYANYFVTHRFKPTMWTHFFWVKQNLPKNLILTNLKKVRNKYIWYGINLAPPGIKPRQKWGKLPINWCKIVSVFFWGKLLRHHDPMYYDGFKHFLWLDTTHQEV